MKFLNFLLLMLCATSIVSCSKDSSLSEENVKKPVLNIVDSRSPSDDILNNEAKTTLFIRYLELMKEFRERIYSSTNYALLNQIALDSDNVVLIQSLLDEISMPNSEAISYLDEFNAISATLNLPSLGFQDYEVIVETLTLQNRLEGIIPEKPNTITIDSVFYQNMPCTNQWSSDVQSAFAEYALVGAGCLAMTFECPPCAISCVIADIIWLDAQLDIAENNWCDCMNSTYNYSC